MGRRKGYEDAPEYPGHYTVCGMFGVAYRVLGWETEPDEDTEWTGMENRTGNLVMVMVGDDRHHSVEPDDVTEIPADGFCRDCGQIGCGHNVYS